MSMGEGVGVGVGVIVGAAVLTGTCSPNSAQHQYLGWDGAARPFQVSSYLRVMS